MSTISITATGPAARQRRIWAAADHSIIASRTSLVSERLCDDADLRAGWRVLDVATGSGNAAIAAARMGCDVVGIDFVPQQLERAGLRAGAERLQVGLAEADAQSLPFGDGAFDAATSVFGVMFAPDQDAAARELLRVVRPHGTIALASWTPNSFFSEMFAVTAGHGASSQDGSSPFLWGSELGLRRLLGHGLRYLQLRERRCTFRYRSPRQFVDAFRHSHGPTARAFEAAGAAGEVSLESHLLDLVRRHNRNDDGSVSVKGGYLEAIGVRR